jgi:general secretion pathway protein H
MRSSSDLKQSGFTLIEIMVVVVIVAIISSAVVPMMTKNADDLLTEQAERFVALVNLAQNEAILQSRQLGLQLDAEGYSFLQQDDEGDYWTAFSEGPFRKRNFSSGTKTALYLEDVDMLLGQNDVDLDSNGEKKLMPQVFLLSSGEMTPFRYEFSFSTGSRIKVSFDAIGGSQLEKIEAQ